MNHPQHFTRLHAPSTGTRSVPMTAGFPRQKTACWRICAALIALAGHLLAGCDGMALRQERRMRDFAVTADDFDRIAETSFALIDPKQNIKTIVAPSTLDPRALAALRRIRPVVPLDPPSPTASEILPAGYFLIRIFTIDAADAEPNARIEGQLGPVTRAMTAANLPDCGTNYVVAFFLTGGDWYSPSYKIETCAESRQWVPVDPGKR